MTSFGLSGNSALVTGGTSGIGSATARLLAERGAQVIVSGRDRKRGELVVGSIRDRGGKADFVAADLADADAVDSLAKQAVELGGGHVDILVNNAGAYPPGGPTSAIPAEAVDACFAVNVRAPFLLVGKLAPQMAERGHGAIVNVSTIVAQFGMVGLGLYGSAKAALTLLTKAWAAEYGPSGVRVNAVNPGPTRTEGTTQFGDFIDQLASAAPAGRVAAPAEIAAAIAYLASEEASFVQGTALDVDGGRRAV